MSEIIFNEHQRRVLEANPNKVKTVKENLQGKGASVRDERCRHPGLSLIKSPSASQWRLFTPRDRNWRKRWMEMSIPER